MKSQYIKPMIAVETLSLGMPLAQNCTANREDVQDLIGEGFFTAERTCEWIYDEAYEEDHICYHSNVLVVLLS